MIFSLRALLRGIALIAILAAAGLLLKEFGIAGSIGGHVERHGRSHRKPPTAAPGAMLPRAAPLMLDRKTLETMRGWP